jgi:hypothetical protein
VPECLFYKRDHGDRSMRAHANHADQLFWFSGKRSRFVFFPKVRMLLARLRVAVGAPKSLSQKRAAFAVVVRRYVGRENKFKNMFNDLQNGFKRLVGAGSRSR